MNFTNFILFFAQSQSKQSSSIDWGMWGVIATILVGTVPATVIYFIQARRKSLKIVKVSSAPLIKIDDKFADDLEVIFQGEKIKDATSIVLRIINSGNQAITKNDFEDSIVIMFNCNTEIIKTEILKMQPKNIKPKFEVEKNNIALKPLLINPQDNIEISAIVSSFDGKIDVAGRIKDIKEIKIEDENSKSGFNQNNRELITAFTLIIIYLMVIYFTDSTLILFSSTFSLISLLVILIISCCYSFPNT